MFKIVKSEEPIVIESVNILIYGEPGSGKTSLVNTAESPLTLDFDKGVHRSDFRKDVLVIENWKQINDNMKELINVFSDYKTIILDTVDTLLDYMGAWIIDQEPKFAKNKLQYYGKLKDEFSLFVGKLKTLGKDVVMIAHVREKEEGDFRVKRPAITGGSYDRVLQTADFVGYLYMKDNKRTLDFNPTDYWIGKNSAKFKSLIIPDFNSESGYFGRLIKDMKTAINGETQAQAEAVRIVKEYSERIAALTDADALNSLMSEFSNMRNGIKSQLWDKMKNRAKDLELEFNKTDKKFVGKSVAQPAEQTATKTEPKSPAVNGKAATKPEPAKTTKKEPETQPESSNNSEFSFD